MKDKIVLSIAMVLVGVVGCFVAKLGLNIICNSECQAQSLYKNAVFYKARGNISKELLMNVPQVQSDRTAFSVEELNRNGIAAIAIMKSGEFVMVGLSGKVILVAVPKNEDGRLSWDCMFLINETGQAPISRPCG